MFRADFDLDLDLWTVKNAAGEIVARHLADRYSAEDVADAMTCAARLDDVGESRWTA